MPNYTVQDQTTGKKITFEWNNPNPPNDSDMEEIFSQANIGQSQTNQPKSSFLGDIYRKATIGVEGFNKGFANTLGMPVDIMNKTLSLVGLGSKEPFMGSQALRMPETTQPKGFVENTVGAIGEQIPYGMSSMLLPGSKLLDVSKYAFGAGIGSGTARTIAPDSPYMDLAGQLIGGTGIPAIKTGIGYLTKPQNIQQAVGKGIEKGVKPSVIGKSTAPQIERYFSKAENAVEIIIANKSNLQFTDEVGQVIQGKLPGNLKQFSQAIDQTKRTVFSQYNDMAVKAGQKQLTINLKPINQELEKIAQSNVLTDLSPGVSDYAWNTAQKLLARRTYTVEEAQDAIALLNRNLESFYKNPTYETASKAYIDSLVANNLRKSLDNLIESTVAPGYQGLKNQYGALKTIEKEINQRAIVDARKNVKGLLDFSDIYSGYHVINGILSLNPATVGAGVAARIISWLYKIGNDPNRIIKTMFSNVEKLQQPKSLSSLSKAAVPSAINVYSQGNRMEE